MRLKYIFATSPIHFLDEDNTFIGDQPLDQQEVSFDVAYSRPVGTFNGLEIWGSKYFGKNIDLYGILDAQRNVVAWCTFDIVKHSGYATLTRMWVQADNRGNNHILTIVNFVIEKCKEKVLIDSDEMTPDSSRKMIKKWYLMTPQYRHFAMKFMNGTDEITNPNIDEILSPGMITTTAVILENVYNRNLPRFGAGKRIIKDFKWY